MNNVFENNVFEIVNVSGTRIDEMGNLTQSDGVRFKSLAEADKWLLKMNFKFTGDEQYVPGDANEKLEWYDDFNVSANEFSPVGFGKWQWRHTKKGWACKVYLNKEGWVHNEYLKDPSI